MISARRDSARFWLCSALTAACLLPARAVLADDRVSPVTIAQVEAAHQDKETEIEAERNLIAEAEYKKLRSEQKRARIEALKLELQRRRRKRFTQDMNFKTAYDTNYFRERTRSEKQTTVFTVTPTTKVDLGGDRIKAVFNYTPGIEVPTRFDEHRVTRFYQNFGSRIELPAGKKTFVRNTYGFFRGVDRANSETTNFSLRTEHKVFTDIEYFLSKKISGAFEHQYSNRHFSKRDFKRNSSFDHWFLPRMNYYITPKTSIFTQVGLGETIGGSGQYNSTNMRMSVGVNGRLTRKSTANINFGVLHKNLSENPRDEFGLLVPDYLGPYLEMAYIYRFGPKTLMQLVAGSATENSFFAGNSFFASKHITFNVVQNIRPKVFFLMGLGYRTNAYGSVGNASNNADETGQRVDYSISASYGFRYQIRRNLFVALNHDAAYRNSTMNANDFKQNIFTAELGVTV